MVNTCDIQFDEFSAQRFLRNSSKMVTLLRFSFKKKNAAILEVLNSNYSFLFSADKVFQ
jgi:hypothetical protein